ncbi:hypothetical protein PIB30_083958 [Stylosanthes scabra]|uniref:Uncharacterized protein n=1 Tax=Stylosanthes scabra TaxID=79078 RepID=A0ABU6WVN5_9FABA|nr:hypothetical protein [Stylosanthes scabra]
MYNVSKISDDKALIELYSSQSSMLEQGVVDQCESNVGATSGTLECSFGGTAADAVVCLSRDSEEQTNPETFVETPAKVAENVGGVSIPEGQGSNGKTFKRTGVKRKMD